MKSFLIVVALLLVPSLALAYDRTWSNRYEAVAGGTDPTATVSTTHNAAICQAAHDRAHASAASDTCKYPVLNEPGTQIGQAEYCNCQCADGVCICTDKLDIYCIAVDKK